MRRSGKEKDGSMSEMLERILSDENIRRAKKRVYANNVTSPKKQTKNAGKKTNEKNDKYDIKLL